jgi:uncharacterized protein
VAALHRYPVKSTAGESLMQADVDHRGLVHDRQWAAYTADGGIASGKRTRRFRPVLGLMHWRSVAEAEDTVPWLISPEGARYRVDDPAASQTLSEAFAQPLRLRRETTTAHHDDSAVHLITTSSLAAVERRVAPVDARRWRANLLVDTGEAPEFLEQQWIGGHLAIGSEVVLHLGPGMSRCVMVDQAQHGVVAEPKVLAALGRDRDPVLGLQASTARPGAIRIGDPVTYYPAASD